jgi:hypothetical protein
VPGHDSGMIAIAGLVVLVAVVVWAIANGRSG